MESDKRPQGMSLECGCSHKIQVSKLREKEKSGVELLHYRLFSCIMQQHLRLKCFFFLSFFFKLSIMSLFMMSCD